MLKAINLKECNMNYREVAFDSNGQAIMWQDTTGRLYTYYGNDFVECNERGEPLSEPNQDLRPIAVDNFGQACRWEDRAGRTYVLDNFGNLIEEQHRPVATTTSYSKPITSTYSRPNGSSGSKQYVSDRFKNVEVKGNKQPQQHTVNKPVPQQNVKPISLATYTVTGKYKFPPLLDEDMYSVTLKIDKQNHTFSYVIKQKDI